MTKEKITTTYSAKGIVYGKYWGGGSGWYAARTYRDYDSLAKLKTAIKKDYKSGRLDSGMGYESLLGALMIITIHKKMIADGTIWGRDEEIKFKLGKFNEDDYYDAGGEF